MSEDSVTLYKEVFDENSEPTDTGEQDKEPCSELKLS